MPYHSSEHKPPKGKMLRIVIWHLFFRDLNQSEKLSEIEPPLKENHVKPIGLPESENSYDGSDCLVMGWSQGQQARLMKHVKLSLVENSQCQGNLL